MSSALVPNQLCVTIALVHVYTILLKFCVAKLFVCIFIQFTSYYLDEFAMVVN